MLQPYYPHVCHSTTLLQKMNLDQYKSVPHKILLLAQLTGKCVCLLQASKPHRWAGFCPRDMDMFSTGSTLTPSH